MAHLARLVHWARLAHGASGAFVPPCAPRALGAPGTPSRAHRFPNLRCVSPDCFLTWRTWCAWRARRIRRSWRPGSSCICRVVVPPRATEPSSQGGATHGVARFAGPATEPLFRICPLWLKNQWPLPAVASDRGQGGNGPRRAGRGRVAGRLRVGPGRDLRRALRACPRPTMADAGAPLLRRPLVGGASSQRASERFGHSFDCSGALGALPDCVFTLPI